MVRLGGRVQLLFFQVGEKCSVLHGLCEKIVLLSKHNYFTCKKTAEKSVASKSTVSGVLKACQNGTQYTENNHALPQKTRCTVKKDSRMATKKTLAN